MANSHRVIVTCGPAFEPIDGVRRITNHSTGELGVRLANRLAADEWKVVCFIGKGGTWREPLGEGIERVEFGTNDDLRRELARMAGREEAKAVFQAAALCDFRVKGGGTGKLSSRAGAVTLELEPAPKVIAELRGWFPTARIVGWKFELEGTPEEVVEKGRRQLRENATDACVLNGTAYGAGFGVLLGEAAPVHLAGKGELCDWLSRWLAPGEGRALSM